MERAGRRPEQILEQYPVQADLPGGRFSSRSTRKRRADYVLELTPGLPVIIVEAKRSWSQPADGIQQAIRYAGKLGVPLALSTNGTGWVLYDATTGQQRVVDDVPTAVEAWDLLVSDKSLTRLGQDYARAPFNRRLLNADGSVKELRYYQRRAIHEALCAMAADRKPVLLVMATGSDKTFTARQLVWKLWNHRRQVQAETGEGNFGVLYLADRDVLVSDPWKKTFRPVFGEARDRVRAATARHSPDIYFATYQVLDTPDPNVDADADPGETRDLLQMYPSDFFDLVIVDECHRGSARAESEWRAILEHFGPATQLGLTATPVDRAGADTFGYFGNPVYTYSLAQGIEDGFLAPYTIRRVVFDVDADGLEVVAGLLDASGRVIPEWQGLPRLSGPQPHLEHRFLRGHSGSDPPARGPGARCRCVPTARRTCSSGRGTSPARGGAAAGGAERGVLGDGMTRYSIARQCSPATIRWSRKRRPHADAAARSRAVARTSASLGSRLPPGWL